MTDVASLRAALPEAARDISLSLENALSQSSLEPAALWGVAVAAGFATRHRVLAEALVRDAERAGIDAAVLDDALSAAAGNPARPSTNRTLRPKSSHLNFKLFSLAVSAINGCESCVQAHERAVTQSGMSEDHVHDAVRIAATIAATAVSLEAAGVLSQVRATVPLAQA